MEGSQGSETGTTTMTRRRRERSISRYSFHRRSPWMLTALFAVQHLLVQAALIQVIHCLLIDALPSNQRARQHGYQFMATSLFSSGICTLLQTTLGSRLPLVQAPSFEYLIPAVILIAHPTGTNASLHNGTEVEATCSGAGCPSTEFGLSTWKDTLSEVRGAVVVCGGLQVLLGVLGVQGLVSQHSGPMVLAPMLSIVGLSCYKEVAMFSSSHWGVTALMVLLVVLFSQHLRSCSIPVWRWKKSKGFHIWTRFPIFTIFSLLVPIVSLWALCVNLPRGATMNPYPIGGVQGILGTNNTDLVPWFRVPFPGEWGAPTFNSRSAYAGAAMALGGSISSLGCYVMCAKVTGSPHPPRHSCNRGICAEGAGSCIAALLGGVATTASSIPNIAALTLTQVHCRRSVQTAAALCVVVGLSAKLTYFLTTVPMAVHGGVLGVTYAMAVSVGVSYFQYTNIDSGRNIFIIGFTVFMALLTPRWFSRNPDFIATGITSLDLFLLALLNTPVIEGGILAFLLDNTVSGTSEERGLVPGFPGFHLRRDGCPTQELASIYRLPSGVHRSLTRLCPRFYPFCNLRPASETTLEAAELEEIKDLLPAPVAQKDPGEGRVTRFSKDAQDALRIPV